MKIIITARVLYPFHGYGGMERYVYYISKFLAKNGAQVEVITSRSANQSAGSENFKVTFLSPNINKANKYLRPIFYLQFLKNTAKYLKKADFDILYSFGVAPVNYLKLKERKPVVVQPFGSEEFVKRSSEGLLKRIYIDLFMRRQKVYSIRNVEMVASEGGVQTQEIVDLFGVLKEKIFFLPDGVDLKEINDSAKGQKIKKSDFGLLDADVVLINANRLVANKGVCYLIDALKMLNEKLNVKLILIGAGIQEANIKKQIRDLKLTDKVVHFKNISNEKMYQLYALADISVTPTLFEGLPLVVLEAMAAGMPIIASNVSEVPQVVKDGENGYLIPPGDPAAIAAAVLKIKEKNSFKKMGEESLRIIKNYDWDAIAKLAIKEFGKIIHGKESGNS